MSILGIDTGALLEEDVVTLAQQDDPIFAHVIDRGSDQRTAHEIVMEARVLGTTLTALCGHKWVPERDPTKYPICPKCEEILNFAKDFYGDRRPVTG